MEAINNKLSPASRVWVYQSSRVFTPAEAEVITGKVNDFVIQWTAHKLQVTGAGALLHNRFIILAADESEVGVSGCSVDSSVNFIRSIGQQFNVNFFDRWLVSYKNGEEVITCSHQEFEKKMATGLVNDETIVFNTLVQTKAQLDTKWEIPYKDSWLKNVAVTHTSFNSVL